MMKLRDTARDEQGFTLVELMVALTILAVALVMGAMALTTSLRSQLTNEMRDKAVQLVRDKIETARALPYGDLGLEYEESPLPREDGLYTVYAPEDAIGITPVEEVEDFGGVDYTVQTDVVWRIPEGEDVPDSEQDISECGYAKEIIVEVSWLGVDGDRETSATSWVRVPAIHDCVPSPLVSPSSPESTEEPTP